MKTYSNEPKPLKVEDGKYINIYFDEKKIESTNDEGETTIQYEYESVDAPQGADYPTLVSAIVRTRYSSDAVEAIILNDNDTAEHAQQYADLEAWRTHAKEVAKQVLGVDSKG